MAKAPKTRLRKTAAQPASGGGVVPFLLIGFGVLLVINWQVAVFSLMGLLPTFVLAFTGGGAYRANKLQCVAYANIAAITPFASQLWARPSDFSALVGEIIPLMTVYMGAAFGYILLFVGPLVAAVVLQALSQDRLRSVMKQRQAIIDRWGGSVVAGGASSTELD